MGCRYNIKYSWTSAQIIIHILSCSTRLYKYYIFAVDTSSLSSTEILSLTQLTQHSITLSWTSVSGSFGYYISYERLDFSVPVTPTYMRLGGSDNTSVTLIKLTAGSRYMIRVWATDGSGVSQPIEKTVKTEDDSEFNVKL